MKRTMYAWIPVLLWLSCIVGESTATMSAAHTGKWVALALSALHLHASAHTVQIVNFILRKSGHFLGYGILALWLLRAFLMTLRPKLNGTTVWQTALVAALFCTLLVASADEFHQRFLPGRTATPKDVALDMTGACILSAFAFPRIRREN